MSPLSQVSRAERLRQLFLALHAIMSAEGEEKWIRGVRGIIAVLAEAEANPNLAPDRIAEARQTYRSMNAGNGSFSDFHVWRDSIHDRVKANSELSGLTEAIRREFESHA